MAHSTSNWQTWKPEIDAYFQDELNQLPESLYKKLFTVRNTDRLQETEVSWSGFNPMVEVDDMGDAVADEAIEGYKNVYQRRNYRKKAEFSSNLMETDQSGEAERIARAFAQVIEYSRNMNIFGMFRNAWNSLYTYGDGKTLVSTAHPLKNGMGTFANTFSDGVQDAMTYDSVLELQDVMLATVSNSGNLMSVGKPGRNKVIICTPYLREKAFQIAKIDTEPDTADRNENYIRKGDRFDVLEVPYLTYEAARQMGEIAVAKSNAANFYDTMWGIVDLDLVKQNFKVKPATGYAKYDDETIKSNQVLVKYAYDKYAFGCSAPFGIALSKGDGTTFSS